MTYDILTYTNRKGKIYHFFSHTTMHWFILKEISPSKSLPGCPARSHFTVTLTAEFLVYFFINTFGIYMDDFH